MSFTYFIPQQDANAVDVIPLTTGGKQRIINPSEATGKWTSTNPDFPNSQPVKSDPNDKNSQHVLTAKTLGVQKNLKNLSRTNGYRVGDVIEYTLNFELSDYFALGDALLTDTLSDGQAFDPSFLPQLQYTQHTQSLPSANFLLNTNYSVATDPTDPGRQVVTFELSQELIAAAWTLVQNFLERVFPGITKVAQVEQVIPLRRRLQTRVVQEQLAL